MKTLVTLILVTMLAACGTVGGAVAGAGKDLTAAGVWIQSKTGQ
jgi:predicted small secreted protein